MKVILDEEKQIKNLGLVGLVAVQVIQNKNTKVESMSWELQFKFYD